MAETGTSGAADIAALLQDYVPRADYESTLEALESTVKERDTHKADLEKVTGRSAEIEKKLRGKAAREAYGKAAEKLKVDPKFRDDLFDIAKVPADADEPDQTAIEKHLAAFLKEKPAYITPEPSKPKTIPVGEGSGRGQSVRPGEPELRVKRSELANAMFMRDNQAKIREAQKAGVFVIDDD